MELVSIFIGMLFLHSLVSARIAKTPLTTPIVFTVVGLATPWILPSLRTQPGNIPLLLHTAELGLVLLLFADASRTDLTILRNIRNLPVRLLSTGMLLTLALGALLAKLVFPHFTFWEAGILAAILAPTDAGLGQVIVSSPNVPMKVRQALNVEAGLNDGLSVPFLLFFIALSGHAGEQGDTSLGRFILEQLGLGTLVGVLVGLMGGSLLGVAHRRKWMAASWEQLGVVTLPLICMLLSEACAASMFIASFVAGLTVQVGFPHAGRHSVEFTEEWGQLFNLSVFLYFGLLVARAWPQFQAEHLIYAVLSLTVIRMIPVAIALWGSGFSKASVVFMGWFGPRGLASIVLGLVYLEQVSHERDEPAIRLTVMVTVLCSIFAHGLSALPGMRAYAKAIRPLPATAPEKEDPAMPSASLDPAA